MQMTVLCIMYHDGNYIDLIPTSLRAMWNSSLCSYSNIKLQGTFEVVKLHLYKYWMMPSTEARTGTAIDFISLLS